MVKDSRKTKKTQGVVVVAMKDGPWQGLQLKTLIAPWYPEFGLDW